MRSKDDHFGVLALSDEVWHSIEVNPLKCYQCGKCSAGCPLASDMDFPPSVIMHMLQTGRKDLEERILRSHTIWLCLACEMCVARCPMEIDIPKVMDFLREKSLKEGKTNPQAKDIIAFHKSFLLSIQTTGRLYEVGLIVAFKSKTFHLMQDVNLAPGMYFRGKLALLPELIKGRKNLGEIFRKTLKKKEEIQ